MNKYPVAILFIVNLLVSLSITAQPNKYGVPLITNYPHTITQGSEQNWCITQDLRGVMYIGNVDKGVLEYDGVEWRSIPIPNFPIVRSMITGDDGIVYVGAEAEFGRLEPDANGNMHYKSLSDSINWDLHPYFEIWKTYYSEGKVYFCTIAWIFIYDIEQDKVSTLLTPENTNFSFFIDNKLYCGDYVKGLMRFEQDSFVVVPGGEYFQRMNISGVVRYDSDRLLVGTFFNGAHLLNTTTASVEEGFVDPELNAYLINNVIRDFNPLNKEFAFATQFGGLVILDRNGQAREIITETEGLISQTVTSVYSDERLLGSGPLWITNFQGISKLETNNPFRVFTESSGFNGLVTDIIEYDGNLFVSTSRGLYFKYTESTGTRFIQLPEIQDIIWDMQVFKPDSRTELLLVTTQEDIFVVNKDLVIYKIVDRIINLPENEEERKVYGGNRVVLDPDRRDVIYVGLKTLLGLQYNRGRWKEILRFSNHPKEDINSMEIDKFGYIWTSTLKRVVRMDTVLSQAATMKSFYERDGLPSSEKTTIYIDPDTEEVLFGTVDGFYQYNYFRDTIMRDTVYNSILPPGNNLIWSFHKDHDGEYWFSFENEHEGYTELVAKKEGGRMEVTRDKSFQRLLNASVDVFYSDSEKGIWFSKSNELYNFDKSFSRNDTVPFQTIIRKVIINSDSMLFNGTNFRENHHGGFQIQAFQDKAAQPEIKHRYNNIEFRWAAPYFEQEDKLKFSYMLEGFDKEWSDWSSVVYKDYTNLRYDDYTMRVKAMNVYGNESLTATYSFTILRPWYASIPAIIAYILLSGLFVYIIIKLYTRRLKQENIRLEGIIQERTAEIRKQKEELTDSIEYASRIQRALLPPDRLMDENGIDHFILFRPRDIVSGDFYWMGRKNDKIMIVAADCTGHGVPGAFMSMLGMTFLDEIVIKSEITSTDEILEQLREHVITALKQSGKSMEESTKDGMDLAMISMDLKSKQIQYSGAYNPLYLVRKLKRSEKTSLKNGQELDLPRGSIHDDEFLLLQIRADQMPIGISEKKQPFNSTDFKDEGYNIYMFSDGFLDQFGGPQGKKFMSKNFKKLILELQSIPLREQGAALEKILLGWMGEISQIDDILVMGLRMGQQ